ncbi:hemerythrin domain-containing protein [Nonomuraea jiangxiensis]|uniref:Hemerythrin HHE cation binding domain-containing protein n=1 Tax=Nonomuraea jiangxiensis TaxID=633440 RepID=A0A1G9V4B0_9ACTN|nr:hemerythrin domain-containing protein [Nonomuraea jiangxiensis]SDM66998.1 Hemerythrin HHE cation binding domain-containing protein [Nonomuraea jiangxiensis]
MGENDVIDVLVTQHGQIRDLFDEVEQAPPDKVGEAFERLTRMLSVHETAEEEIVHPYARRKLDGGEGVVDDRLNEENRAKRLLLGLHRIGVEDPAFWDRLAVLRTAVTEHARSEERYEFAQLRANTSVVERRAMAAAVRAAEALAPIRPHPGTESAAMSVLVGTPLAVMDRAREMIRKALGKRQ